MADDPLAAALEEIRERCGIAASPANLTAKADMARQLSAFARLATEDAPRLLGAVEAVLEVHALTERVQLPCAAHHRDGWDPLCPQCEEYQGCAECHDGYRPLRPGECTTRQAITRALLGEGDSG